MRGGSILNPQEYYEKLPNAVRDIIDDYVLAAKTRNSIYIPPKDVITNKDTLKTYLETLNNTDRNKLFKALLGRSTGAGTFTSEQSTRILSEILDNTTKDNTEKKDLEDRIQIVWNEFDKMDMSERYSSGKEENLTNLLKKRNQMNNDIAKKIVEERIKNLEISSRTPDEEDELTKLRKL
jgi:hypothetical protein